MDTLFADVRDYARGRFNPEATGCIIALADWAEAQVRAGGDLKEIIGAITYLSVTLAGEEWDA